MSYSITTNTIVRTVLTRSNHKLCFQHPVRTLLSSSNDDFFHPTTTTTTTRTRTTTLTRLHSTSNDEQQKQKSSSTGGGHDVRSSSDDGSAMKMDPEELKIQQLLAEHQQNAPKLGFPVDVRTLVQYNHGFAVMSTNSKSNQGYPGGSIVGFAPDENGRPIFIFSGMSTHTQDLLADPRCSITIASKDFKGAADGRVNLMGRVTKVPPEQIPTLRDIYKIKHPTAFWVDFGDFNWFRMDDIISIRFVGGFARAGSVTPEEYINAQPDPIAAFGGHVAKHMNEDHMDSTKAMISYQIPGLDVSEAVITSLDSLGMYVKCTRMPRASDQPQQFKIRVPFSRRVEDRKDVKSVIVEMTKEAASALGREGKDE